MPWPVLQASARMQEIVYDPPLALRAACVGAEGSRVGRGLKNNNM
jgi:hypothetical protein